MENRDEFLLMDDETLSRHCELEFFKGTGNGGQKRNKTSSSVRVRLIDFPLLCAEDCTERSQHRNRANALRKLRLRIAYAERAVPALPPERNECAVDHDDYPLWLAHLLDLCEESNWEIKPAAEKLGRTPTAFLKLLARDPELWQFFNRKRAALGKNALRHP